MTTLIDENDVVILHSDHDNGSQDIVDSSLSHFPITVHGNVTHSTLCSKFGGSSLRAATYDDYIEIDTSGAGVAGTEDFTLDFWGARGDASNVGRMLALASFPSMLENATPPYAGAWQMYMETWSTTVNLLVQKYKPTSSSSSTISSSLAPPNSARVFDHYAYVRESGAFRAYKNGILKKTQTVAINMTDGSTLYIGHGTDSSKPYNDAREYFIDELRFSVGVARWTANFTPPTEPYAAPPKYNKSIVNALYTIAEEPKSRAVDQNYTLSGEHLITALDHIYGIKLGLAMAMYYGDAPALMQISNQYYGDAPALIRSMQMKYGNLLAMQKHVAMPYHILKPLQAIMEARYGINGEALQAIMEQNYSLSEYNLLLKKLEMPYLLQSDSMVQEVSTSLTIAGNAVAFTHLNIERSHASFVITGEAHLAELSEYMQIELGDEVAATCNATTYNLIVVSRKRSRPGGPATTFIINFESPAITLTAPWSRPLLQEFAQATAESIINDLLGSLGPVDYLAETFPVLADTLYANDEDARTIIRKLTQSVGAVMQSNPDGSIRIEPEYPVSVPAWEAATPDYYLTDEKNFVSQDETPVRNSGQNKYLVGNQLSSDERIWTEQNEISANLVEVLGFQVPWASREVVELTHSGGSAVQTPEYMGVVEETSPPLDEPAEQVEFVAGFSSAKRPIYGDLQITWMREQLGSIAYAEDGKLEAELKTGTTDGYSLAEIRYTTKYHKWLVRDNVAEDVQFILWVAQ